MVDEDVSRRTIAVYVKTGKLTARALAYTLGRGGSPSGNSSNGRQQPKREYGDPEKSKDFLGRGGATERANFGR